MQSKNTWHLSEAEVEALGLGPRSDDPSLTINEWLSSVMPSEKPRSERLKLSIPMSDPVNPEHYKKGGVECIDAIRSALTPDEWRGFLKGTAIAYLWRLGHKDAPEQDARKTAWYVSWLAGKDPRE